MIEIINVPPLIKNILSEKNLNFVFFCKKNNIKTETIGFREVL